MARIAVERADALLKEGLRRHSTVDSLKARKGTWRASQLRVSRFSECTSSGVVLKLRSVQGWFLRTEREMLSCMKTTINKNAA